MSWLCLQRWISFILMILLFTAQFKLGISFLSYTYILLIKITSQQVLVYLYVACLIILIKISCSGYRLASLFILLHIHTHIYLFSLKHANLLFLFLIICKQHLPFPWLQWILVTCVYKRLVACFFIQKYYLFFKVIMLNWICFVWW